MKKNSLSTLLPALCALLLAGCAPAPKNAEAARSGPIVCFGDSVTAGLGVETSQAYPALLAQLTGRRVVNAGVSGDTTEDALARLGNDVLALRPGLVVIEIGGNDYLKQVPFEQTKRNIDDIIGRIQASGAMAAVVDPGGAVLLRNYSAAFQEITDRREALFLKHLLGDVLSRPSLKTDPIHPNNAGHKKLADGIYAGIKKYLK
ncbi:MAG: hypothetical protein GX410_01330 [Elusimicrobia bacterium]|nr:hypothetical protein [Elusimicrobiota bacterium]